MLSLNFRKSQADLK